MGFYSDLDGELRAKLKTISGIGDVVTVRADETDLLRLVPRKPGIGVSLLGGQGPAQGYAVGVSRQWQNLQWKLMLLTEDNRGAESGAPASQQLAEDVRTVLHYQISANNIRSRFMFVSETFHGLDQGVTLVRSFYKILAVRS